MLATICPRCSEAEETVAYHETGSVDLWFCESCGYFYMVHYKEGKVVDKETTNF